MEIPDGIVLTRFYPNWSELSEEKQNKVKASREMKSLSKISGNEVSEIKTLIKMYITQINTSTQENEEGKNEDGSVPNDVGTQFGGTLQKGKALTHVQCTH